MTVPGGAQPDLQVQPLRVINALKQRLLDEISKTVLLEAALAESQERERALTLALSAQQQPQAEPALADGS